MLSYLSSQEAGARRSWIWGQLEPHSEILSQKIKNKIQPTNQKKEEEEGEEEEGNNDDDNGIPGLSDTIVLQQLGPKTTSRTLKLFSLS